MPAREGGDVEPHEDGWAAQREGTDPADSLHGNTDNAMARGIELAKAASGQLRIKGRDRKIQYERTYSDDPYPPTG